MKVDVGGSDDDLRGRLVEMMVVRKREPFVDRNYLCFASVMAC